METRRWVNPTQPQTMQIAVFLLYFDAVFLVLERGFASPLGIILIVGSVAAGFGIANERKWGYFAGVGIAAFRLLPWLLFLLHGGNVLAADTIGLMIAIAKLALLVHPQSRNYQRIWFK